MPASKALTDLVQSLVNELFGDLLNKFVRPTKQLRFNIITLPDLYRASVLAEGGIPLHETADGLSEISAAYVESARARTQAALLQELSSATLSGDAPKDLDAAIAKIFETASSDVQRTIETEAQRARSVGILEGITHVAAKLDDSDPNIVFITAKDNHVCDECVSLHVMPDGITPRCWKLSQVQNDYHKKGGQYPSRLGLHPHCRCTLTYIPPGFGFKGGRLAFMSDGYDLYGAQQGQS